MDGRLGGGTDGGGGGERQEGDGYGRLIMWEYTIANVILGTEPNAPLDYDMVLEIHHPIMSTLGGHGLRLKR